MKKIRNAWCPGKILGIEVYIDSSWLIIFALVTWTLAGHYFPAQHPLNPVLVNWALGFTASLLFFASVLAHELGHSLVARQQGMGVSPATIRNEMSVLEEKGYVAHPHTSAGRVPTDLGYRYFVQFLLGGAELAPEERKLIQEGLQSVELSQDQWLPKAATLLARSVHSASVV